jgi:hypothetical protein
MSSLKKRFFWFNLLFFTLFNLLFFSFRGLDLFFFGFTLVLVGLNLFLEGKFRI